MVVEKYHLQEAADDLINMRIEGLNALLGPDWKDRCLYSNMHEALPPEYLAAIEKLETSSIEKPPLTETERTAAQLNDLFLKNGGKYVAHVIEPNNSEQKIVIAGFVGGDLICMIPSECRVETSPNHQFGSVATIGINGDKDVIAIISPEGKVFRVDKLLRTGNKPGTNVVLIEPQNRKSRINKADMDIIDDETGIIVQNPYDTEDVGSLLHEIGHILSYKFESTSDQINTRGDLDGTAANMMRALVEATKQFNLISKTKDPVEILDNLTPYQIRQIVVNEERRAWAIGMAILREAGNELGIRNGSPQSLKKIQHWAQQCLETYDRVPHTLRAQAQDKIIPNFTDERRKAGRQLKQRIRDLGIGYHHIPNFDEQTGENIANDPRKIMSII